MSDAPETVENPEALLKAYNKAKEDLVALREEKKALEAEFEEERQTFSDEAVAKWKGIAVEAQALKELHNQGVKDGERILKRLDLSDIEFDDETKSVKGLDTKLDEFKTEFPELFDVKRRASRTSADIHADKPAKKEIGGTEAQVARIMSQR